MCAQGSPSNWKRKAWHEASWAQWSTQLTLELSSHRRDTWLDDGCLTSSIWPVWIEFSRQTAIANRSDTRVDGSCLTSSTFWPVTPNFVLFIDVVEECVLNFVLVWVLGDVRREHCVCIRVIMHGTVCVQHFWLQQDLTVKCCQLQWGCCSYCLLPWMYTCI